MICWNWKMLWKISQTIQGLPIYTWSNTVTSFVINISVWAQWEQGWHFNICDNFVSFWFCILFYTFLYKLSQKKKNLLLVVGNTEERDTQKNEHDTSDSNFRTLLSHGKNLLSSSPAPWTPASVFSAKWLYILGILNLGDSSIVSFNFCNPILKYYSKI